MFAGFVFIPLWYELTPKWGPQLSAVFTLSWLVFKYCLYIVTSCSQPTLFLYIFFFISRPLLTAFPCDSSSANQNSLSICCWYVSVFNLGVHCNDDLYFENLPFSFLFVSPFSYMFLSFTLSHGGPVNIARKLSTINRSP